MIIGEIIKNEKDRIRVSIENFKGNNYVDIRVYFENDKGEWTPTKKGVTIQPEKVEEFREFIAQAQAALKGVNK